MFTGIVEELGTVVSPRRAAAAHRARRPCSTTSRSATRSPSTAAASPSSTGTTATTPAGGRPTSPTSRTRRTNLGDLAPGDPVNLERPVRLADRLGGHLVQGHVDGVGEIVAPAPDLRVRIATRRCSATSSRRARSRSTASASPSSTPSTTASPSPSSRTPPSHHARPQGPGRPRQPGGRRDRQVRRAAPRLEGTEPDMAARHRIEDAVAAIGRGEIVVVVDDEDRENEGDLIMAAEFATPGEDRVLPPPHLGLHLRAAHRRARSTSSTCR